MAANVIAAGALRIGQSLVQGARLFKRGVQAGVKTSTRTADRTAQKINNHQKKINTEKKRQGEIEKRVDEEIERREKEGKIESKGAVKPAKNLVDTLIKAPLIFRPSYIVTATPESSLTVPPAFATWIFALRAGTITSS